MDIFTEIWFIKYFIVILHLSFKFTIQKPENLLESNNTVKIADFGYDIANIK
jgi:hypothetical protein